ncbi:hypothetical protein HYV86_03650 [Candidatus Woesearchaeota archaeon]|nr:hypothetical protein [Candidatus Woesearchaeota archaeon]
MSIRAIANATRAAGRTIANGAMEYAHAYQHRQSVRAATHIALTYGAAKAGAAIFGAFSNNPGLEDLVDSLVPIATGAVATHQLMDLNRGRGLVDDIYRDGVAVTSAALTSAALSSHLHNYTGPHQGLAKIADYYTQAAQVSDQITRDPTYQGLILGALAAVGARFIYYLARPNAGRAAPAPGAGGHGHP